MFETLRPRFPFGQTVATANAHASLDWPSVVIALGRHARGDWGECDAQDWASNEDALRGGGRLLSVYRDRSGTRFWIITEADRSITTVLLPEDY